MTGSPRALTAYALVIGCLVFSPTVLILLAAATAGSFATLPPDGFSIRWYLAALTSDQFSGALVFSGTIGLGVAAIASAVGIPAAIAISRVRSRAMSVIHAVVMAPMMFPHIVLAIALLELLAAWRIPSSPFGIAAGHVVIALPFVVRLSLAGLERIDPTFERASYSLGASASGTFFRVTLPLVAPAFAAAAVFAFLVSFDEAGVAIFLSLPGRTTMPAVIYEYATQTADPTVAAAGGVMILLGLGAAALAQRSFGLLTLLAGGARV